MVVCGFGFSSVQSISAGMDDTLKQTSVGINVVEYSQKETLTENGSYRELVRAIDKTSVSTIIKAYQEKQDIYSYISFSSNDYVMVKFNQWGSIGITLEPIYCGGNPFVGKDNYLEAGRMWNASDEGKNNIWLGSDYINDFNVGDTLTLEGKDGVYTIMGFITDSSSWWGESNKMYLDYTQFTYSQDDYIISTDEWGNTYTSNGYGISGINLGMSYNDGADSNAVVSELKAFIKEYNVSKIVSNKNTAGLSVTSSAVSMLALIDVVNIGIIILVIFLSVVLILLSIGSVSNTVKISVEQSSKTFGMMKAIGMQNSTLKSIVNTQANIMAIIATALASLLAVVVMKAIKPIMGSLMSMFGIAESMVVSTLPWFVPFAVLGMLIFFIVLFTRKSLAEICKMDVISVISEVN